MLSASLPDDFDQRFERTFAMAAYVANRYVVGQMRRAMLELDGDLECTFICGTLAMLNVAAEMPPGSDPALILDPLGRIPDSRIKPVRLSDLSQVTGLPRETVRRKLEKLRQSGHVERLTDGAWQISRVNADEASRAFTRETIVRLLAAAREVNQVLNHPAG